MKAHCWHHQKQATSMRGKGGFPVLLLRTIPLFLTLLQRSAAVGAFQSFSCCKTRVSSCPPTHRFVTAAMASRKRSATTQQTDLSNIIDRDSLLYQWASHDNVSFHDFSTEEATAIHDSLLSWYRDNRRKLPWRGDPPPFDGSTAGVNSNNTKKNKNQPSIKNFFAAKPKQDATGANDEGTTLDESTGEALPVTAYGVWVSEIMLQQTRVEAVIPFYLKWMKRFPTVYDLANASEEDVNAHWAGLGFYRRARLLHKGAKKVVEEYNGQVPDSVDELTNIDGIGRYTASAIASIAFDVTVPVVDGNVCRVLSRLRGIATHIKSPTLKDDVGWTLAEQIVSAGDGSHAGQVNQALMELGATYCAPSGTGTDDRDPLRQYYMSTKIGEAFVKEQKRLANAGFESFPTGEYLQIATAESENKKTCKICSGEDIQTILDDMSSSLATESTESQLGHSGFPTAPPKKAKREEVLAVAALSYTSSSQERWLLVRRPANGLLAGQWEFPSSCVWSSDLDKKTSNKKKATNDAAVEVPIIEVNKRTKALDVLLADFASSSDGEVAHEWLEECSRVQVGEKPVEHIFSHVRHTMWIEHGSVPIYSSFINEWKSGEGKELRWMSEDDMKDVGVTAGVKKILKAVKSQRQSSKRPAKKKSKKK